MSAVCSRDSTSAKRKVISTIAQQRANWPEQRHGIGVGRQPFCRRRCRPRICRQRVADLPSAVVLRVAGILLKHGASHQEKRPIPEGGWAFQCHQPKRLGLAYSSFSWHSVHVTGSPLSTMPPSSKPRKSLSAAARESTEPCPLLPWQARQALGLSSARSS